MTNYIRTNQVQSSCAENPTLKEAVCTSDYDCIHTAKGSKMSGRWTGRCIFSMEVNSTNQTKDITRNLTGLCEYSGRFHFSL